MCKEDAILAIFEEGLECVLSPLMVSFELSEEGCPMDPHNIYNWQVYGLQRIKEELLKISIILEASHQLSLSTGIQVDPSILPSTR